MESTDEKLHQRIEQSKINEAKEMAKKKAMELDKVSKADRPSQVIDGPPELPVKGPSATTTGAEPLVTANPFDANTMGLPDPTSSAPQARMPGRGMVLKKKPATAAALDGA